MPSPPMQRALALAGQAGHVSPNPAVGCVIVKDGQVVGEGYYAGPGSPHAEVAALSKAGATARGATVYVTLEPCRHDVSSSTGQPRLSCSRALIDTGVGRVVCSMIDPDPRTSGQGKAALEAEGIEVEVGDGAEEASKLMEAYLKHRRTGLPFVIVKYAASLDGRIAAASGDSRWVSGPETLHWAHANRPLLDAIMVGASTVVIDDPQLTARPDGVLSEHQPLRVVVDSTGRISAEASVLKGDSKTLIATTHRSAAEWRRQIEASGAQVLVMPPADDGRVPLRRLLEELGRRGVLSLLVEGGGVLHGSFFDQRLVDKVTAVIAPMIVGAGAMAVDGAGAQRMAGAVHLRDITIGRLGDDILVTGYPVWPAGG
ncbi:MAG: bifunctional diaminohydroxyphosphoribosylaminopyrimidine deaminase/5-amino-6-(5-phosphoribosylamino)uracil reductase RibD [Dehalococcoidia bacterium]|nr:bifunctional diaminohydroxyphosphoribosylaminopyrimidine deaminase/5-amino-6-(5-phosphoribosylamino)uracil reductase RibD [Dehalococcoidia bacterium]